MTGKTVFKIAAARMREDKIFALPSARPSIPEFSKLAGVHRYAVELDRHGGAILRPLARRQEAARAPKISGYLLRCL